MELSGADASIHARVKKAGTLKSLSDAGNPVEIAHRQAHRVQIAMALSAGERDEPLLLRKDNKRLQIEQDIFANAWA